MLIALVLSITSHILPMFLTLPKLILLNIAGTFLISYSLGTLAGMLYAGVLNIVISSMGMGSGVVLYVLLTQVIEAGFIGILNFKKNKDILNLALISLILAIVINPISMFLYALFNKDIFEFLHNIISIYTLYLKTGFLLNLASYLFSAIVAYIAYKLINNLNEKGRLKDEKF